jgi:hypothetical protein
MRREARRAADEEGGGGVEEGRLVDDLDRREGDILGRGMVDESLLPTEGETKREEKREKEGRGSGLEGESRFEREGSKPRGGAEKQRGSRLETGRRPASSHSETFLPSRGIVQTVSPSII